MVDEVQPAVPDQQVGVAPRPVDVVDPRVEPQHPSGQVGRHRKGVQVEVEGTGQEVDAEVETAAGPEQVLHLLVGLTGCQDRVDLDADEVGHRQLQRPGKSRAHHLRDECLAALSGAAELDDVGAEVVRLHQTGQRPTLAQRRHVARGGDGGQHARQTTARSATRIPPRARTPGVARVEW